MKSNPLVSICIPAYNAAPFIENTINDWLNQSYQNTEIIVQDDYSTDQTYEIALAISEKDDRIKVFKNSANLGIGKNWNEAYRKAGGAFVIIANADDIYEHKMIENALNIFEDCAAAEAVSFRFSLFHEKTGETQDLNIHNQLNEGLQNDLFRLCFFQNPFSIVFTVFKGPSLERILRKDGNIFLPTQICDSELFFRFGKNEGRLFYSNMSGGKYRKHNTNNSYITNGEKYSWMYDVFPHYRLYLKENYKEQTKKLLLNRIGHEIRYSLKNKGNFNLRFLKNLIKNYLTFTS